MSVMCMKKNKSWNVYIELKRICKLYRDLMSIITDNRLIKQFDDINNKVYWLLTNCESNIIT